MHYIFYSAFSSQRLTLRMILQFGPICLSDKNFDIDIHSLSFNPLPPVDFPLSDMRVQTSCRQNVQISAGIACGRTPCANSTDGI